METTRQRREKKESFWKKINGKKNEDKDKDKNKVKSQKKPRPAKKDKNKKPQVKLAFPSGKKAKK